MRWLLLLALILSPTYAVALTGPESRFDWSLGQPAINANATENCTDTATARFDWSLGQPAVVHDATANCTAAAADDPTVSASTYIPDGALYLKDGGLYLSN